MSNNLNKRSLVYSANIEYLDVISHRPQASLSRHVLVCSRNLLKGFAFVLHHFFMFPWTTCVFDGDGIYILTPVTSLHTSWAPFGIVLFFSTTKNCQNLRVRMIWMSFQGVEARCLIMRQAVKDWGKANCRIDTGRI